MSVRSAVEFNHDVSPGLATDPWTTQMAQFFASGDAKRLPDGATLLYRRHHSEASPLEELRSSVALFIVDLDAVMLESASYGRGQKIARLVARLQEAAEFKTQDLGRASRAATAHTDRPGRADTSGKGAAGSRNRRSARHS
jgi:hypothetical protein